MSKFIQIAVSEDEETIHLYALDATGRVWEWDYRRAVWRPLPTKREEI